MSRVFFSFWVLWTALPLMAQNQSEALPSPEGPWVVRAYFSDLSQVQSLADLNEPWVVNREQRFVVVDVDADLYNRLIELGFLLEVDPELTATYNQPAAYLPGQRSGIPGFPCYKTLEETYTFAQELVATYPNLAEWVDIGDTWEKQNDPGQGHDLMVLKLTNQALSGDKPKLFVISSIHAREYAPAELNTRFAEYLVTNYNTNADATWLLDYHEIHLLLQANPDGRTQAETGLSWRKNANNDFCSETTSRGIDLNRNFSFMWGCCGGSSSSECSLTFRGPTSASEPETQAIINYARLIFPDQRGDAVNDPAPEDATGLFIDLHSFGGLVLWPYGFNFTEAPNGTALQTLGRKLAFFNDYTPEKASVSFVSDGTTDDFTYGDLGVAAFTFEIGTTFFQPCDDFEHEILPDNTAALIYAAKTARTPYQTPAGPETFDLSADHTSVVTGQSIALTATANDTRYHAGSAEPTQNIATVEYYLDIPPWEPGAVAFNFTPTDGAFNQPQEAVEATILVDDLDAGRHTVFTRAMDSAGNWGTVQALFFYVFEEGEAASFQGSVQSALTGAALPATVQAGPYRTTSSTQDGQFTLYAESGTYGATAIADGFLEQTHENLTLENDTIFPLNFELIPVCDIFNDDGESGLGTWEADPPWNLTTEAAHSGSFSWTDSPNSFYDTNSNHSLRSQPLDLTGFQGLQLHFWQRYAIDAISNDFGIVEVSSDNLNWTELMRVSGSLTEWNSVSLALPEMEDLSQLRFRFRFLSDSFFSDDGWYLDDIRLSGAKLSCSANQVFLDSLSRWPNDLSVLNLIQLLANLSSH